MTAIPASTNWLHRLSDLSNNPTVAAGIGAALATIGAIATVLITDWLRNRTKARRTVQSWISHADDLATQRLEAIRNRGTPTMAEVNLIIASAEFSSDELRRVGAEAFDQLSIRQRRAIGNIVGAMVHADRLNKTALEYQVRHRRGVPVDAIDVNRVMDEEAMWLERTAKLCEAYRTNTLTELGGIPDAEPPSTIDARRK